MSKCIICKRNFFDNAGLGHHIKSTHKMTTQEYYDKYVHQTSKNCPICHKPNRFVNFITGYTVGCCTEHTNLIKYGAENVYASEIIKDKCKQIKLEKYGSATYNNRQKTKQTVRKKYGFDNVSQVPEFQNKRAKTNIENIGVAMPFMSSKIQEKASETKQKKYNNARYTNRDKFYQTMKKAGFISSYETSMEGLFHNYGIDYIPQYHESRYPYRCDFYLPEYDMFIEINVYPAHGPQPYDKKNPEHKKLLKQWREKVAEGKTTYSDWIRRWTVVDVKKRHTAKENNLQYFELYNKEEIDEFIQKHLHINDSLDNYL